MEPTPRRSSFTLTPSRYERLLALLFGLGLLVGLTLIFTLNFVSTQQVSYAVGDRATEQILAPQTTTFRSEVLTEEERNRVTAGIFEYTPLDRNIGRQQTNYARNFFLFVDTVRADQLAPLATRISYLQATEELDITPEVAEQLLTLPQAEYNSVKTEIFFIISDIMQNEVRQENLEEARDSARQRIGFQLNPAQENIVASLAPQFIIPNIFFDPIATEEARTAAAAQVEPVEVSVTQGQVLLRVGDVVRARDVEMLTKLGLLQQQFDWYSLLGSFMVATLIAVVLSLYWSRFQPRRRRPTRDVIILTVLFLAFTLAGKVGFIALGREFLYLFPAAALGLIVVAVFDINLALLMSSMFAFLMGYMANYSLEIALLMGLSSATAVLALRDTQRFYAFLRAGAIGGLVNMAVITLFHFNANSDPTTLLFWLLEGFANGFVIVPMVTIAGFFLVGLFGLTTVIQLQDLSRLDHALLKELLRQAPGTYHHSIMVANLAEQAAERIGASSTLVRVGAFYHDIGKMKRPMYFTENQEGGVNPHDNLDPYTSARIITAHVTEGLEMAKAYRLPSRIQDFITEHHGDRILKIFYEKARATAGADADAVDKELFRYQGSRPHSRETGIVLLADTVEAASSALRPSSTLEIERLVHNLVDDHVQAGQLDFSGLTMGDISQNSPIVY
jgi:cyclic-di-AMP phosphodiesterase PgpH